MRAPQRRVHVQLPMCSLVTAALQAALAPGCLGDAACRAGLSRAAKLVELSVMIALPGAEAQQALPPRPSRLSPSLPGHSCTPHTYVMWAWLESLTTCGNTPRTPPKSPVF